MNRKQRRTSGKGGQSQIDALFALAVQHHQAGRIEAAKQAYAQVIALDPGNCCCLNNLGLIAAAEGRIGDAEALYAKSATLNPAYTDPYNNLGNLLVGVGHYDRAIACFEHALQINANAAGTHVNLGNALQSQGRIEPAIACYQRALALDAKLEEAHLNLGNALNRSGRLAESVASYQRVLALNPDHVNAHGNLGAALRSLGKLDAAVAHLERALRDQPDHIDAHLNLGNTLSDLGRTEAAVAHYRHILSLRPDHVDALSNLLFALNYTDTLDGLALARQCREVGQRLEARFLTAPPVHGNPVQPDRRLKVGYVSPDFRRHAVAFFLEPLLRAHDRAAVEIFCYAQVLVPDDVTRRLQALADHWFPTIGVSDDDLAARIRADGIDILIDLAGHSAHNRLSMFARRPAPVQATWLGYPNTTGLTSIGYRLVDDITDPEGSADMLATETLVRLDGGFLCYQPPADAPAPVPPPCLAAGAVTFGSFNNLAKLSATTLDLWCRLLVRVPSSRLLIKSRFFAEDEAKARLLAQLAERGVAAVRVILPGPSAGTGDQLAAYHQVDIALDSSPYNGTTTTCEALWMGVPVVTLAGASHRSRVGASLLTRVGLPELIAQTEADYLGIAAALAADPARLTALRAGLRERVATSPLCDAPAFAREMEAAYRLMWHRWCDSQGITAPVPSTEITRLYFGDEPAPVGWTAADLSALGRFADGSITELYADHVLQRLDFQVGLPAALKEMHRVLKADGLCRIAVPDLEALCRLFLDSQDALDRKILLMSQMFGETATATGSHRTGLSHDMLAYCLGQAGFRAARRVADFAHGSDRTRLHLFGVPVSLNLEVWK